MGILKFDAHSELTNFADVTHPKLTNPEIWDLTLTQNWPRF